MDHPRDRALAAATAIQPEALLDVAGASTAAGVVGMTVDIAQLDLTDRSTLRALVAVAAALTASGVRVDFVGMNTDRLIRALQAAPLTEVFVLWAALRGPRPGRRSGPMPTTDTRAADWSSTAAVP